MAGAGAGKRALYFRSPGCACDKPRNGGERPKLALFPAGEVRRVLVLRAKGIAVDHGENSFFQGRVLVAGGAPFSGDCCTGASAAWNRIVHCPFELQAIPP